MGGYFGVASKESCVYDVFFGTDYHSHLGTRRGGMVIYDPDRGFQRAIHNIENSPFRTKFEADTVEFTGNLGIGCISDMEPQPVLIRSAIGTFAVTTVSRINNIEELVSIVLSGGSGHFFELSGGKINPTEVVATLIARKDDIAEGIKYVQSLVDGSLGIMVLTPDCIYAARDRYGRTPMLIGHKEGAYCASFESFAYYNIGYADHYELGPGEIVKVTADGIETVAKAGDEMRICAFLWTYFGYPTLLLRGGQRPRKCGIRTAQTLQKARPRRSTMSRVCPTPALPTPSDSQRPPACPLRGPSSNIPPPGPAPSCRKTRACVTSSPA